MHVLGMCHVPMCTCLRKQVGHLPQFMYICVPIYIYITPTHTHLYVLMWCVPCPGATRISHSPWETLRHAPGRRQGLKPFHTPANV